MIKKPTQKRIEVCAHWQGIEEPILMGILYAYPSRGKEIFSFEYNKNWLKSKYAQILDPNLGLFSGPQYMLEGQENFGIFLDSSPDRWGRVLMQRREAQLAKSENRTSKPLMESDYLLGVYDEHRMGALRFRKSKDEPFLDDNMDIASPPWAKLRDLEYASLQLENDNAENEQDYMKWLKLLIAPGGSLGGTRPKASVVDEQGHPWIAKFPSRNDEYDIGKWEYLVYQLTISSGIEMPQSDIKNFSGEYSTFMSKRFDRTDKGERLHFASAMTLLGKKDGDGADTGVSYLDLAGFIIKNSAQTNKDLEQLWRRIVFYICVSNTDDHLRNHGFILTNDGWVLSPAYDINPVATGNGLALNISKEDNSLDIDLAKSIAPLFRLNENKTTQIIQEIITNVSKWKELATKLQIPSREINLMQNAFRLTN